MIKKILILLTLLTLSIPSIAFANDGGSRLDDENYLSIEIKPESNNAEIDGDLKLHVTLQNNTDCPIVIRNISNIFKYNYVGVDVNELDAFDEFIMPGKKVYFEVTTKVPPTIDWYIKDGKYYTDINFKMVYDMAWWKPSTGYVFTRENYDNEDIYWYTYNAPLDLIPIEITNLHDGQNFLDFKLNEIETEVCFRCIHDGESNSYRGEYYAHLSGDVILKNISNKPISNVLINTKIPSDDQDTEKINLQPEKELTYEASNYYYMKPEDIPKTLSASYQATFLVDDKYYGVYSEKVYPTDIIIAPDVTFEIIQETNIESNVDEIECLLKITNNSAEDYLNFYYEIEENLKDIIPVLKSGEAIEIPCKLSRDNYHYFYMGLLIDDYAYLWDSYSYKIDYDHIDFAISSSKNSIYDLMPTAGSTETVTLPLSTSTEPSPSPSHEISVIKTDEKSVVPPWAFIILAIAVIFVAVLIYLLRTKKADNET